MDKEALFAAVAVGVLMIALYACSWLITCGVIKLIAWCLGATFSWKVATGIWLALCLLKSTIRVKVDK